MGEVILRLKIMHDWGMTTLSVYSCQLSARCHTVIGCNAYPLQLHLLNQLYGHFWLQKATIAMVMMPNRGFEKAVHKPISDVKVALSSTSDSVNG